MLAAGSHAFAVLLLGTMVPGKKLLGTSNSEESASVSTLCAGTSVPSSFSRGCRCSAPGVRQAKVLGMKLVEDRTTEQTKDLHLNQTFCKFASQIRNENMHEFGVIFVVNLQR